MTPARPLVATAAGTVLLGLLAACSHGQPPVPAPAAPAPTATVAVTPQPEHAAEAPEVSDSQTLPVTASQISTPAQDDRAKVQDETGASLFAAYFLQTLNYARATGDSSPLRSISVESCTGCEFYADVIDEYHERGYTTPQFVLQFTGTDIDAWDATAGYARLTVLVDRPAYNTLDRNGSIISSDGAAPDSKFWIEVTWRQEQWMALEVE
ncbi:DUF6318 family protein [Kineococcus sp. TBRC 1896]|uniref:DUF6318 family protein n=1 Tax=Kineococcus mangrovi TaxID=1660183 RepID=A0ABV4HWB8_9ACTN